MFTDGLGSLLGQALDWFGVNFKKIMDYLGMAFGKVWGIVLLVTSWVATLFGAAKGAIHVLGDAWSHTLGLPDFGTLFQPLTSYIEVANYWLPLDLAMMLTINFITLWIAVRMGILGFKFWSLIAGKLFEEK